MCVQGQQLQLSVCSLPESQPGGPVISSNVHQGSLIQWLAAGSWQPLLTAGHPTEGRCVQVGLPSSP